jgi:hypothetical protein
MAEANHALHLAEALTRYGAEIHVLTTQGAVTEGLPFTVHALMRDWSWKDVPRFARFLRRCRPDAVLMIYIGFLQRSPRGDIRTDHSQDGLARCPVRHAV